VRQYRRDGFVKRSQMSPDTGLDAILRRFPGPVMLYPSRRKWACILAGSGVFTMSGIWMVARGTPLGWPVLIFFLLCATVAATALLPGAGALTLDGRGFEVKNLFRCQRISWQSAMGFQARAIPPSIARMVIFDSIDVKDRMIAKLATAIAGRNGALPDTYGFSAEDLASLMARWRDKALQSEPARNAGNPQIGNGRVGATPSTRTSG
jgi:hypothetical protein